jgi:starch synthase
MRILSVSNFFDTHGGGLERVAGHLAREFHRLGHRSAWAASDADGLPENPAELIALRCINPTEALTGLPMPVPGLSAVRRLIEAVRASDAVVIHDALYVTSVLAMLLAKLFGKPAVLVQHIAHIPFSSRLLRFLMMLANKLVTRPMLWAADSRVFISDTVRQELLGTPARLPFTLLFNGVDHEIFHPASHQAPLRRAAAKAGSMPAARRVLFVGRYVEKKGLNVVRELAARRPDFDFLMIGSGPIKPERWGLPNVHDLGSQTPRALAELYREADLLLLPSVGEGYPLVIQEAMACGLPIVCGEPSNRADPDAARWLRGVAIDLADPGSSAARCGEAIDQLECSPADRAAMARHARDRYDWQTMAKDILALMRSSSSHAIA